LITQHTEQPQQPDHPEQRAEYQQQGTAQAARVSEYQRTSYQHREGEIGHDVVEAINQVAHQLGEADDVDLHTIIFQGANVFLQLSRKVRIVQCLARLWIDIQHRHEDHRRTHIVGDVAADDARAVDVLPQALHRLRVTTPAVGNHRTATI